MMVFEHSWEYPHTQARAGLASYPGPTHFGRVGPGYEARVGPEYEAKMLPCSCSTRSMVATLACVNKSHTNIVHLCRGFGLFIGFEVVKDGEERVPNGPLATELTQRYHYRLSGQTTYPVRHQVLVTLPGHIQQI